MEGQEKHCSFGTVLPSPVPMGYCKHLISGGEISNLPHQDVYEDHHVRVVEDAGCILAGKDVLQKLQH